MVHDPHLIGFPITDSYMMLVDHRWTLRCPVMRYQPMLDPLLHWKHPARDLTIHPEPHSDRVLGRGSQVSSSPRLQE